MLIWRGRGIFAVLIFIGVFFVVDTMVGAEYFASHGWPKIMVGVCTALPVWFLGKKWNEDGSGSVHDVFFVPMQYTGLLLLGAMLVAAAGTKSAPVSAADPAVAQKQESAPPASEPTPVQQAAAIPPTTTVAPPPVRREPERVQAPAEEPRRLIRQVYADNTTLTYYPENCPNRPATAFRIGRSIALQQGYTLAAGCSE
jgi:hypothetical protein